MCVYVCVCVCVCNIIGKKTQQTVICAIINLSVESSQPNQIAFCSLCK